MAFRTPPLPELAFSFARFVASEHRRFHFHRRIPDLVAARRQNFGRNFGRRLQRRHNRNGGLRHRRAPLGVSRRRYSPGGGFRRRHNRNHLRGNCWAQRRHSPGAPGPSTRAVVPREEIPIAPEVGVVPEVVAAVPDAVAAPEVAPVPEAIAEQVVDAEDLDEASASNITTDVDDLLPPLPAFVVPPMEWLLGGPSAGWLIDDPERYFSDEEEEAMPPLQYYLRHGYGPFLPSPTPSDEDPEHFAPPGYAPVTESFQPPTAAPMDVPQPEMKEKENDVAASARVVPALPDLNLPAPDLKEKAKDTAPSASLPTPSPEARVLLRRFASAMAARPSGIRIGTWSPARLGFTDLAAEPRLPSSSVEASSRR